MKNFNLTRFKNVAVWDLTINRPFYKKMLIIILSLISVPVLALYIVKLWSILLSPDKQAMRQQIAEAGVVVDASFIATIISVFMSVLMGYIFHNLLTRQSRINELTLPASNCERFSWHVVRTLLVWPLVIVGCVAVVDLMQLLLNLTILGSTRVNSIFGYFIDTLSSSSLSYVFDSYESAAVFLSSILMPFNWWSVFALGNAWKYRYNIALTIGWAIALSLTLSLSTGLVLISSDELSWPWPKFFDMNQTQGVTLLLLFTLACTALIWWLTYRLYCRAQITTRRNP